ncbi:MAG: molecular chaperone HtpG [Opitutales bacterium]
MSTQTPEKHNFQAETKQVLDIVVHSLYTDKEIFIRELISNASDATEKLRHAQLTEDKVFDDGLDLEININADDTAKTFTIQDFGIGMTREDLVENLGTIAHSGSKAFLEALKQGGEKNENLIGQFGVGFYSVFMVADQVEVYTRSWHPDGQGWKWSSDGSGTYEIEPVDGLRRGTKIIARLKEEHKEYAGADRIKGVIKRYSAFVNFPINVDGEKVNTVQAIWLRSKGDVTEEEYKEFYKFQANAFDEPMHWLHFNSDAPLTINALLFTPSQNQEQFGFGRMEPGVALHCRKVLIDGQPKGLLPDWLRFLRGVVDSADLPLNISRESMQESALVAKLNNVLTKRYLKSLADMAKKESEKYNTFWKTFGHFIKEGVATDFTHRDQLAGLLRFESSMTEKGELTSLDDYLSRAKEEQKSIYYITGPSRAAIESGPYLEAFKARGLEVLFLYEGVDTFVMNHLREYKEKQLQSADAQDLDLGEATDPAKGEPLDKSEADALTEWAKKHLGEAVTRVDTGERLTTSPAAVMNADPMMTAQMRQMMAAMGQDEDIPAAPVALQLNPRHPLVHQLNALRTADEGKAHLILDALFDNARLAAGILEDPKDMIQRVYQLLQQAAGGGDKPSGDK